MENIVSPRTPEKRRTRSETPGIFFLLKASQKSGQDTPLLVF
jgi:hypothetical protein